MRAGKFKLTKEEKLKLSSWAMKINREMDDDEMLEYFPSAVVTRIKNEMYSLAKNDLVDELGNSLLLMKKEVDKRLNEISEIAE